MILPVLPVSWLHCQPGSALLALQSGIQQPRIELGFSHLPTAALCSAPCRRTTTRAPTPCRASASTRRSRATAGACGWCCCRTRATGTGRGRACCTPCTSRCGPIPRRSRTPCTGTRLHHGVTVSCQAAMLGAGPVRRLSLFLLLATTCAHVLLLHCLAPACRTNGWRRMRGMAGRTLITSLLLPALMRTAAV